MQSLSGNRFSSLGVGIFIAIGLIGLGALIGGAIMRFRTSGRYVTVKGLAEREVNSDVAVWKIRFKTVHNDLAKTNEKIQRDRDVIVAFLKKNGFGDNEIEYAPSRIIDLYSREYGPEHLPANRFIHEATVSVKSTKISLVETTSRKTDQLISENIILDENTYGSNPVYVFDRLNEIRPQMLAEATKSARTLAEQFAADSGSRVGSIRQANQGSFQILNYDKGDSANANDEFKSPKKLVRVVSTIDYFLVD